MPQSDLIIQNSSRPEVLSDINAAILALATKNSGFTEPPNVTSLMEWADLSTGLLKIRNLENTDWLVLGKLNQEALGYALRDNCLRLRESWAGDGTTFAKFFALPAGTKRIDFDISGSDLSPFTAEGVLFTIKTGSGPSANTGNTFIFTSGANNSVTSGQATAVGTTAPTEIMLDDVRGELETFALKGSLALTPNGRLVYMGDIFRIIRPFPDSASYAQTVRRMGWTVTSSLKDLQSVLVKSYQSSTGFTKPFPVTFNIKIYITGPN